MFFQSVKKQLRTRNILWALLCVVLCVGLVALAISNGFSSETGWKLGPRGTNVGIPISNWVVSVFFLAMTALFAGLFVSCMKEVIKNTTYEKLLTAAQAIGDVDTIDQHLAQTPKSGLAKGELRYNSTVLFYRSGTEATLLSMADLVTAVPIQQQGKQTEYFVEIAGKEGTVLKIATRKKDVHALAKDILACKEALQ